MNVEKKVPEIRFKGFSGKWELNKLGQVYSFNYGVFNNNPSNGGQYPVYGANGIIGGYTSYNAESSAVIGHMGEYAGSVLWAEGKHFVTYNGTIAKPKKSDFSPLFGYFKLVKMNLKKICGGSGQPFLSYDALERLDILFPTEKEQTAIGNYFQKLDSLINQHQQQHAKLSNIKKAMLEKMFPKTGETLPEIRFKGFSGEWVEQTLGEVFSYERPDKYIVQSTGYSNEYSTPVLTANKGFLLGYTYEKSTYNNPSIIFDDFTLDCKFVDYPYMVKSSAIKILTIKDNTKYDLLFAFHLLNTTRIEVMGHARHYISVVQNTKIAIPNKREQSAISKYFQKLDALINQHQQQISKLTHIKQAFLSKMFV